MIKTAQYIEFEEGFIKEAVATGCDEQFLRGYLAEADDMVDIWKSAFDKLAEDSHDPNYRLKLANELLYFNMKYPELLKEADFMNTLREGMGGLTDRLGIGGKGGINEQLGGMFAKPENKDLISSLIAGGGGGGLIGLLLGVLTGHPMVGLMLGGLGGAGLGAGIQQNWFKNLFDKPTDTGASATPAGIPNDNPEAKGAPEGDANQYNAPGSEELAKAQQSAPNPNGELAGAPQGDANQYNTPGSEEANQAAMMASSTGIPNTNSESQGAPAGDPNSYNNPGSEELVSQQAKQMQIAKKLWLQQQQEQTRAASNTPGLLDRAKNVGSEIGGNVQNAAQAVGNTAANAGTAATSTLQDIGQPLVQGAANTGKALGSAAPAAEQAVKQTIKQVPQLPGRIGTAVQNAAGVAAEKMAPLFGAPQAPNAASPIPKFPTHR